MKKTLTINIFSEAEKNKQKKFAILREKFIAPFCPFLQKIGINPNHITFTGALFLIPYAYIFSQDIKLSVLFIIPYLIFDGLDGAYARVSNKTSKTGALFDIISDHAGMIISIILIIKNHLAAPALSAYYGMIYIVMIFLLIIQNTLNIKIYFVIRSKYLIFAGLFILAYFEKNYLQIIMTIFSIIMTISCIISILQIIKKANAN